ncbi:CRISPR-associated endonuclease Cas1 [Pasteurellaceae bacterium TAE3-ERU1]|nr:CRISPR-associated endonuclease Cas1 [Pasteurellaceae bacterium TAE3-ERU1]
MTSLFVDRKNTTVKLKDDALAFYEDDQRVSTIPLLPLERIFIKGDVNIQASLVARLGEMGVGVIFLSGRKNEPTMFLPNAHNDVARRIGQYALMQDADFCLQLSKLLIKLKLSTQLKWLKMVASSHRERCILLQRYNEIYTAFNKIDEQTELTSLRGLEGNAARVYFSALATYLPRSLNFTGRNRRPPRDPFNALMSLGYTLIHSEAVLATHGAGLDPYIGFFHALDFGRQSLACDVIEPLRPLIDNWLIDLFKNHLLRVEHFSTTSSGCFLGKTGRVQFYKVYEKSAPLWRKILSESSRAIGQVIAQTHDARTLPQTNLSSAVTANNKRDWAQKLQSFYFNQQQLIENAVLVS